ncbi:MAG: hypothetical protein AAGF11_27095 [Myxococcota bacterium]
MRTRTLATLFALVGTLGLCACDQQKDPAADAKKADAKSKVSAAPGKAAVAPGGAKADPAPVKEAAGGGDGSGLVKLEKLGLMARAPADSSVGDAIVGEGVMVQGPDLVATVEEATDTRPKTEVDAKKNAEELSPKNFESEALEDGWAVTYDNESGMGPNFFVEVRRDIGGKTYWCETTASKPEQQAKALAFCKSLKK